jgi:predicted ATP-grasp superfamily ATP-dependent carboligase
MPIFSLQTHKRATPVTSSVPAVVVGACSHGLALIRAIAKGNVKVHVLESNDAMPGLSTRYCIPHLVDDINGDGLIANLIRLRKRISPGQRPVLFLTNDHMVRQAALHMDSLALHYRLSWADSAQTVLELLHKNSLEHYCAIAGLRYPKTAHISHLSHIEKLAPEFTWPCIVKPVRPLSSFKVKLFAKAHTARHFLSSHTKALPVLLQEWIEGGEDSLYFSVGYYQDGLPLLSFGGRKLRAFPMGHTTVAEPEFNAEAAQAAAAFFANTGISGIVSLEMKRDSSGVFWVIEPTVGRTDFWIDLCLQNNINFPLFAYYQQIGQQIPLTQQRHSSVWINTERETLALFWYLTHMHKASRLLPGIRCSFYDIDDLSPFRAACQIKIKHLIPRLRRK